MPFSTFSSELQAPVDVRRIARLYVAWSVRTLVGMALFCVALEGIARFGFAHVSRIEARIAKDHAAALAIRKSGRPAVLLVGNSLLLEDIDTPRLRSSLHDQASAVSFPIEETEYLDWFYGLRRFFEERSRPDVVVLCINVRHLISSSIRGDYSVYYLFRIADIPEIRQRVHYDLTKASDLVLSRFSLFYAARNNLRNFVLIRTAPSYAELRRLSAVSQRELPTDSQIRQAAAARLFAMRKLCSRYGAKFVFLLPPGFGSEEAALVQAARQSDTDLMIPVPLNAFGRDQFKDGLHLNTAGAQSFTDQFSVLLRNRL